MERDWDRLETRLGAGSEKLAAHDQKLISIAEDIAEIKGELKSIFAVITVLRERTIRLSTIAGFGGAIIGWLIGFLSTYLKR